MLTAGQFSICRSGVPHMTMAHRVEVVLVEDSKLVLDQLPFQAGQAVEVIVLPANSSLSHSLALQGQVLQFDQPTAPVAEADWGALQ